MKKSAIIDVDMLCINTVNAHIMPGLFRDVSIRVTAKNGRLTPFTHIKLACASWAGTLGYTLLLSPLPVITGKGGIFVACFIAMCGLIEQERPLGARET